MHPFQLKKQGKRPAETTRKSSRMATRQSLGGVQTGDMFTSLAPKGGNIFQLRDELEEQDIVEINPPAAKQKGLESPAISMPRQQKSQLRGASSPVSQGSEKGAARKGGPVLNLSGPDLYQRFMSRGHETDMAKMRAEDVDKLCIDTARLFELEGVLIRELMERARELEKDKASLADVEATLQQRDQDLIKVTERLSDLEMELHTQDAQTAYLTVRLQSLESEINSLRADKNESLSKLQAAHTHQLRMLNERGRKQVLLEQQQAYAAGARDQMREVFLSPQGQLFLDALVHGTLDAYRKSPQFPEDFCDGIFYLVGETGRRTLEMIGATSEQCAALNEDELVDMLDSEGLYRAAGIDSSLPEESEEWVIPAIDKALRIFVEGDDSEPLLEKPVFRTPFLDSLSRLPQSSAEKRFPRCYSSSVTDVFCPKMCNAEKEKEVLRFEDEGPS